MSHVHGHLLFTLAHMNFGVHLVTPHVQQTTPFIPQTPLGVGFRPYPVGKLHVTLHSTPRFPLASGRQKRTLYMSLPLGIRPHPPTYQSHACNQLLGGNAIPTCIPHGSTAIVGPTKTQHLNPAPWHHQHGKGPPYTNSRQPHADP